MPELISTQPVVSIQQEVPQAPVIADVAPVVIPPATPTQPHPILYRMMRPGFFFVLSMIGAVGFADLLFFAFVEYSHFEQGLIDQLILPDKIPLVGLKAALMIFATALAFFFAFQLGLLQPDETKRNMKYTLSGIACVVSICLLFFAGTMHIVSVFD